MISQKIRPDWDCEIIQYAKKYGDPEGTFKESKRPSPYSRYVALMCNFFNEEPTYFEEATKNKEWTDAMIKEYQSIDHALYYGGYKNLVGYFLIWKGIFQLKYIHPYLL